MHGLFSKNPGVRLIPQSRESFRPAWLSTRRGRTKSYSLVDCISMHTMRQHGLIEALTNDRHFVQEGFRALLRFGP